MEREIKAPKVTSAQRLGAIEAVVILMLGEEKPEVVERWRANHPKVLARVPSDQRKAEMLDYIDYLLARSQVSHRRRKKK